MLEQIGKGGMATIYKAEQPSLDRTVAIKVLPSYFMHDETFRERFVQEARAVARLKHPHILPVYDFGETALFGGWFVSFSNQPAHSQTNELAKPCSSIRFIV